MTETTPPAMGHDGVVQRLKPTVDNATAVEFRVLDTAAGPIVINHRIDSFRRLGPSRGRGSACSSSRTERSRNGPTTPSASSDDARTNETSDVDSRVTDFKDDLAALRIDREPERPGLARASDGSILRCCRRAGRRWLGLGDARAADRGRGRVGHRARRRHAGRRAQRVGLRHRPPPRHGLVEDHRQGRRGERRRRHGGREKARCSPGSTMRTRGRRWRWPRRRPRRRAATSRRTKCGSPKRSSRSAAHAARQGRLVTAPKSTGAGGRRLDRGAHRAPRASRCAWPSGRSSCSRPISTTRSSARRSAASRSRRTRSRARWCRRCRPAAASRAPASARSWT